jgi:hypothetical protein
MQARVYMHKKMVEKTHQLVCHIRRWMMKKASKNVPRIQKENLYSSNLISCAGSLSTLTPSSVDSRRKPFSAGSNKHILCVTCKKTKKWIRFKIDNTWETKVKNLGIPKPSD